MAEHVRVLAHFVGKPGSIEALHDLLVSLLAPTRAEAGCIMYDLWRSKENPASFTLVEEWTSEEALRVHLEMPHLVHAKSVFPTLLAEPLRIDLYTLVPDQVGV